MPKNGKKKLTNNDHPIYPRRTFQPVRMDYISKNDTARRPADAVIRSYLPLFRIITSGNQRREMPSRRGSA